MEEVYRLLDRQGYINFGVFHGDLPPAPRTCHLGDGLCFCLLLTTSDTRCPGPCLALGCRRTKVLVLGAGVSGLSVARQLKHFGYEAQVIEARVCFS